MEVWRSLTIGAFLLLGVVCFYGMVESCNEVVCASIVSKCMLTQSCKCELKNCSCCKECLKCLGKKYYEECCSCVGKCNKYRWMMWCFDIIIIHYSQIYCAVVVVVAFALFLLFLYYEIHICKCASICVYLPVQVCVSICDVCRAVRLSIVEPLFETR